MCALTITDSGNLSEHARQGRSILDAGRLSETAILVSGGGLDECRIRDLVASGAPIDSFGVGSKVDTSADLPFLDSAYKPHQFEGEAYGKFSKGEPDIPNDWRCHRYGGRAHRRPIATAPCLQSGRRTATPETLQTIRSRLETNLGALPEPYRRLEDTPVFPIILSEELNALKLKLQARKER